MVEIKLLEKNWTSHNSKILSIEETLEKKINNDEMTAFKQLIMTLPT